MGYTKHDFKSGEKLYASQLNEMDEQIAVNAEEIDDLETVVGSSAKLTYTWEQGYVDMNTGDLPLSWIRIRTTEIHLKNGASMKVVPNGQRYNVYRWEDGVFKNSYTSWQTEEKEYTAKVDTVYRITCCKTDDSAILPAEARVEIYLVGVESEGLFGKVEKVEAAVTTLSETVGTERVLTYTWEQGSVSMSDGALTNISTRIRTSEIHVSKGEAVRVVPNGQKYNMFKWENGVFGVGFYDWQTEEQIFSSTVDTVYRFTVSKMDDSNILPSEAAVKVLIANGESTGLFGRVADIEDAVLVKPHSINTGNFSIVCAKEHTYNDGTAPVIEYFLLEEVGTKRFYISKNLINKQYIFTFDTEYTNYFTFGITNNGDIIACRTADSLDRTTGKLDSNRINPVCWLASESWKVQHEVDFGDGLKPCGWLSNCGFRNLPNGDTLFCEYTRTTVATGNVWKLSGNPADASSWVVKKSFEITTTDNLTGLKHIHTVQYDHYTGVVYISTGDDDDNSKIYYSLDLGETWIVLGTPSQKYCRNLNFTFTRDYIYYAPDFVSTTNKYLFRATRTDNGVMDFDAIEDYVKLDQIGIAAAYGTVYLEEIDAILVLDRCDGVESSMPLYVVDLTNETLHTIATIEAPSGEQLVGFRTRFTEFYPKDGKIRFGFGLYQVGWSDCANHIKGFGNVGESNGAGANNINNLELTVRRVNDGFRMSMNTYY